MNQYGTHDDNIDRTGSIADISDVVGTEEIRIEGRAFKYWLIRIMGKWGLFIYR